MVSPPPDEITLPYDQFKDELTVAENLQTLYEAIVAVPFKHTLEAAHLFLGMISLYVGDQKQKIINLAAVSNTEQYTQAVNGYDFDPAQFQLSLDNTDNDIIKAITTNMPQGTTDWATISRPEADDEQTRLNQASGGIAYSIVYPLDIPQGGALLFCYFQYQEDIGELQQDFMVKYNSLVSQILRSYSPAA